MCRRLFESAQTLLTIRCPLCHDGPAASPGPLHITSTNRRAGVKPGASKRYRYTP